MLIFIFLTLQNTHWFKCEASILIKSLKLKQYFFRYCVFKFTLLKSHIVLYTKSSALIKSQKKKKKFYKKIVFGGREPSIGLSIKFP